MSRLRRRVRVVAMWTATDGAMDAPNAGCGSIRLIRAYGVRAPPRSTDGAF